MDNMKTLAVLISLCLIVATQCSGQCDDIDTKACESMATHNPNLCNDPTLSNTACPKYCKKCPLVCYHCDTSVRNYMDCNTTRACQTGEQCLLHQLVSSRDGHREYRMNCASLDICDGKGIIPTGRRHVSSRNLITQCCSSDKCNYPNYKPPTTSQASVISARITTLSSSSATTPTTTMSAPHCYRDIEVLIEDSRDTSSSHYIIDYLKDLVSHIAIGPYYNQIGIALYDNGVHNRFNLGAHKNQAELLNAINGINFHHSDNDIDKNDVMAFLQHKLKEGHNGDRSNYKDVVIILVDHFSDRRDRRFLVAHPAHHNSHHETSVPQIPKDVIVINIGAGGKTSVFSSLGSDARHVIDVPNYSTLSTTLPDVLSLLCV